MEGSGGVKCEAGSGGVGGPGVTLSGERRWEALVGGRAPRTWSSPKKAVEMRAMIRGRNQPTSFARTKGRVLTHVSMKSLSSWQYGSGSTISSTLSMPLLASSSACICTCVP